MDGSNVGVPPLGDNVTHLQDGLYYVMQPSDGINRGDIFSSSMINAVGENILNNPIGNVVGLLKNKVICNSVISVFLNKGKSLVFTPIGMAFNVTYSNPFNVERLFDQITVHICPPASIKKYGFSPGELIIYYFERDFFKTTRCSTPLIITADLSKTIQDLQKMVRTLDPIGISTSDSDLLAKEHLIEVHNTILSQLNELLAPKTFMMQKSLESGIGDDAFLAISRSAIPNALAKTLDTFLCDKMDSVSLGQLQQTLLTQRLFTQTYVENILNDVFIFPKTYCSNGNITKALLEMIQCGIECIKNITAITVNKTPVVRYNTYTESNGTCEVGGMLILSEKAYKYVLTHADFLHGFYVDSKTIYYRPADVFAQFDSTKTTYTAYGDREERAKIAGLESLLSELKTNEDIKTKGFIRLTEAGKNILAGKSPTSDGRQRHILGDYAVNTKCVFLIYDSKAYILDQYGYHLTRNAPPDPLRRTPSLTNVTHEIFRVTLGDIIINENGLHPAALRWITDICRSESVQTCSEFSAEHAFSIKQVTMYTKHLSPQKLYFSNHELIEAFCDPSLYDIKYHKQALNNNLEKYQTYHKEGDKSMYGVFTNMLLSVRGQERHFKTYFQTINAITNQASSIGINSLNSLIRIELQPFFTLCKNTIGFAEDFTYIQRKIFLEIPPYVHSVNIVILKALFFLAKAFSPSNIRTMNDNIAKLTRIAVNEVYLQKDMMGDDSVKPYIELAKPLAEGFETVFLPYCNIGTVRDINDLYHESIVNTHYNIIVHTILPIVLKSELVYKKDSSVVEPADKTKLLDEIFKDIITEPNNLFAAANTLLIANNANLPPILRVACLFMQHVKCTCAGLTSLIKAGCYPGFAVDYLRYEVLRSEQVLFTVPGSHEIIITPSTLQEQVHGDGAAEFRLTSTTYTTQNTLGPGSLLFSHVLPNLTAKRNGQTNYDRPKISNDFVTGTKWFNVEQTINKLDVDNVNKRILSTVLKNMKRNNNKNSYPTMQSKLYLSSSDLPSYETDDLFLPIIRPVGNINEGIQSVLGVYKTSAIPLTNCFGNVNEDSGDAWWNFFSKHYPTTNPYISNIGSLYAFRFITNQSKLIDCLRTITLETVERSGDICTTSKVLQELYKLSSNTVPILSPGEIYSLMSLVRDRTACPCKGDVMALGHYSDSNYTQKLSSLDIPAVAGLSLPHTCYTTLKKRDLWLPNDFRIYSPFSVKGLDDLLETRYDQ